MTEQNMVKYQDKQENEVQKPDFSDVQNGPISYSNRECRDVLCCLLMVVHIIAMLVIGIYSYTGAEPHNIYRGTDNNQNICGQKGTNTENFPYTYFFNPTTNDLSNRVCVQICPSYSNGTLSNIVCFQQNCTYDVIIAEDGSGSISNTSQFIGYNSQLLIDRVCIPSTNVFENAFDSYRGTFSDGVRESGIANLITDLQENWKWLLIALAGAVVISFFFMFMLRCFAGCFVWSSIILVFLLLVGMGIIFLYNGGAIPQDSHFGNLGIPVLQKNDHYNIFGYITLGLAGVFFILVLCCCNRLRLAVAVCNVAGQFVASVCQVMLVPIFSGLLIFCVWVAAVIAMVGLVSKADFEAHQDDVFTRIADYTDNRLAMLYYYIFGTLWINALLQAIAIFVIASACVMWYYTRNGDLSSPISTSYKLAFRYHFGSLAFGAFILALVEFVQFMMEVLKKQAEGSGADMNKCAQVCFNCLRCYVECLKRIIECINRNAYILIAIRGKNFCASAYDAVGIITSNVLRYAIVSGVGQIIMVIGKLLIAGLTTFLFYVVITFATEIHKNVLEPIYLLILLFIASYAIATVFMSVYSIAMETVLLCFIVDQNNTRGKPRFAPQELTTLIDDESGKK